MGLFEKIFGGSKSTSGLDIKREEGIFGSTEESGRLAGKAEAGFGDLIDPDMLASLKSALGIGGAEPFETTTAQGDVLSQIMDVAGGRSATRGLGAPTTAGLAKSIAQPLMEFRTNTASNISNAMQNLGQLAAGGARGFMDLGNLAQERVFSGQQSKEFSTPGILGTLSKFA
jgi:hypothetical protein